MGDAQTLHAKHVGWYCTPPASSNCPDLGMRPLQAAQEPGKYKLSSVRKLRGVVGMEDGDDVGMLTGEVVVTVEGVVVWLDMGKGARADTSVGRLAGVGGRGLCSLERCGIALSSVLVEGEEAGVGVRVDEVAGVSVGGIVVGVSVGEILGVGVRVDEVVVVSVGEVLGVRADEPAGVKVDELDGVGEVVGVEAGGRVGVRVSVGTGCLGFMLEVSVGDSGVAGRGFGGSFGDDCIFEGELGGVGRGLGACDREVRGGEGGGEGDGEA